MKKIRNDKQKFINQNVGKTTHTHTYILSHTRIHNYSDGQLAHTHTHTHTHKHPQSNILSILYFISS